MSSSGPRQPSPCQGHQQHSHRQLSSPLSTLHEAQAQPRVAKTRSTSQKSCPCTTHSADSPSSQGTPGAGLGHEALCPEAPTGFTNQLCCPAGPCSTAQPGHGGCRQALHVHTMSGDTKEPEAAPKDTVMRNPPKRNMKTKSAVLPRKEPSSSMRQYLYLRAGEKGGAAVKEINSWPPCAPQQDSQESYCSPGSSARCASPGQNSANFTSHHWPQGKKEAPSVLQPELTPGMGTAVQQEPWQQHCQSLLAGLALQQAQMEGQEGHGFN